MALIRITNGFEKMSEARLIERATAIHVEMSSRTAVFPTPYPTMPELEEALSEYVAAVASLGEGGSRSQVDVKNSLKQNLVDILHLLGYYVLFTSRGKRSVALQSGFSIAKEPKPFVLDKPSDLKVVNADQPGIMLVSVKAVKGVRSYSHQYSADPELKEESWMSMNCSKAKCALTGLTPGTTYYFRVGAIGTKDQVKFSDVVSRVAA